MRILVSKSNIWLVNGRRKNNCYISVQSIIQKTNPPRIQLRACKALFTLQADTKIIQYLSGFAVMQGNPESQRQ